MIVERVQTLHAEGVPYEEMAVLYRLNARSADFELAFAAAEIPFQGSALLERMPRDSSERPAGATSRSHASAYWVLAREQGLLDALPPRLGEREETRQKDLRLLVEIARSLPDATVAEYVDELRSRFASKAAGGVHLLTYHRAKGLEFDAVFLPRLEGVPSRRARPTTRSPRSGGSSTSASTRARRHLTLTWSAKPSRFLTELGVGEAPG